MKRHMLLLSVLALLAVACGGDDGASPDDTVASLQSGSGSTTVTTTGRTSAEDAVLEFTRCLREQGVDVPDIRLDQSGQPRLTQEQLAGIDLESAEFQQAFGSCVFVLQNAGAFQEALDPELQAIIQDQLQAFSRCMRENGVTDFPDPDLTAATPYPLAAFLGISEQPFQDALQECRSIVANFGLAD